MTTEIFVRTLFFGPLLYEINIFAEINFLNGSGELSYVESKERE